MAKTEIVLEIPLRLYFKASPKEERVLIEVMDKELDLALEFLQKIQSLRKTARNEK